MIVNIDPHDAHAVRNKDNVLALYELMINQKKPEEAVAKFLVPQYVQHNPLVPDGAAGLGGFFGKIAKERAKLRVVVHRIIAVGDYGRMSTSSIYLTTTRRIAELRALISTR